MNDEVEIIEKRLKKLKQFYLKLEEKLNDLPDFVPSTVKEELKKVILNDKELKELIEGIDSNRPPRIFLMGRTGVGKSSLINALCGTYVAKVSDTVSCTTETESYQCKKGKKVMMEILDTRGIAESLSLDDKISAEQVLVNDMKKFSPDVAILVLNSTHRDSVDEDVLTLKNITEEYKKINSIELPIIVAINKCDDVAPSRFRSPSEFPEQKIKNINEIRKYYKDIILKEGLKVESIVSIASVIDWKTKEDKEVGMYDIPNLTEKEINDLQIAFDGRYNIDVILDELEKAIKDNSARMGLRLAARLENVIKNIAKKINVIFSTISSTIALSPIPISDIYILIVIQITLVSLIALLSGEEITVDSAKEFILGMGGITGTGYTLKLIAQQGSKMLNVFFPGRGSAVSATIAYGGTYAIGEAAIAYYIDKVRMEDAKKIFKKNNK